MRNGKGSEATRRTVLAGGVGLAAALAARSVRAAPISVKIGAIMPSSGVLAFPGQACVRGIDLGVKFAKEHYGLDITVIHGDTQSKPENGRIVAENLIRQGCTVLIGAWDSGATISALQACEAAKVPMVVHIASATQVTSQGFTQVFRFYPTSLTLIRQSLEELKAIISNVSDPPRSMAVMHLNNTFGQSSGASINQAWGELKVPIKITETIAYDEKARDLSVEVAKAKASGADSLLSVTRVNDAIMIARECVKQGWNPKMVFSPNSNGIQDKAYYEALGKYAEGPISAVIWLNPKSPYTDRITKQFQAEYPKDGWLDANAGCAFEAVQIASDAIVRAKSSVPTDIHAALRTTDMTPVLMNCGGNIMFDTSGQNKSSAATILQAQGTAPKVVAPKAIAEASLIYPLPPFGSR